MGEIQLLNSKTHCFQYVKIKIIHEWRLKFLMTHFQVIQRNSLLSQCDSIHYRKRVLDQVRSTVSPKSWLHPSIHLIQPCLELVRNYVPLLVSVKPQRVTYKEQKIDLLPTFCAMHRCSRRVEHLKEFSGETVKFIQWSFIESSQVVKTEASDQSVKIISPVILPLNQNSIGAQDDCYNLGQLRAP